MQKIRCFIDYERRIHQQIHWAIKTFDKVVPKGNALRYYIDLRDDVLPGLLNQYVHKKIITFAESITLLNYLKSEDRDNWYLAFMTIKTLKKRRTLK